MGSKMGQRALLRLGMLGMLLVCRGLATKGRIRINPSNGNFVDGDGRTRIFHGVNAVMKKVPWHPSVGGFDPMNSLASKDISDLGSWGLNLVRLGIMWPGVEPVKGQYNMTYLKVMLQLVDDMYAAGIYTIVDFHQDAFAQMFCGEGVPEWLLPMLEPIKHECKGIVPEVAKMAGQCKSFKEYNYTRDPTTGFPTISDCLSVTFDQYSRTPEVVSSWGNFFDFGSVQQKFRSFWKIVAKTFAGHPGVLGYDLINEPLNGNFFEDPKLLSPGYADYHKLQPMYQALHKVIQSVDPSAISMYEPAPFPDTVPHNIPMLGGVHSVGFTSGPAGKEHAQQALSYHIYSCGFADSQCNREGETHDVMCPTCDSMASDAVSKRTDDAKRLGGGIVLTEFGACRESPRCIAEINRVASRAEEAMHSWAYWQFKYFHDITTVAGPSEGFYTPDGKLQTGKVAALSRTYASVIAGVPVHLKFEQTTGAFRLVYQIQSSTRSLPTEIYLNEDLNYAGGDYEVHAVNAFAKPSRKNHIDILANSTSGLVDVAIARPYKGPMSGSIVEGDNHVDWQISASMNKSGFQLNTDRRVKSWKMIKIIGDDDQTICQLETDTDGHIANCLLDAASQHKLLFTYNIEFWQAGLLNWRTRVKTLPFSFFGPLLGKMVLFTWKQDGNADEEVVV